MSKLIVNEITKYDASQVTFTDNTNVVITGSLSTAGASVGGTLAVSGNAAFDTNTLFVDAANNRVGVKEVSPLGDLHIKSEDTGVASVSAQGSNLIIEGTENGMSILSSTSGAGYIKNELSCM